MKNQYASDLTDYITYGILRVLADPELYFTLGVHWMLTPDDGRRDGGKTAYLDAPDQWRHHDAALFDVLKHSVRSGQRNVRFIEKSGILPGAVFVDTIIPDNRGERAPIMEQSLEHLHSCDIIFFDQDNGLEVPSVPKGYRNSGKYLYYDEVEQAYSQGHSLLLYQHFPRVRREEYLCKRAAELHRTTGAISIYAIRSSHSCFFFLPRESHAPDCVLPLQRLAERWGPVLQVQALDPLQI